MDELFTAGYTALIMILGFIGEWDILLAVSPMYIGWLTFSLGLWGQDNEEYEKTTNANDRQDAR